MVRWVYIKKQQQQKTTVVSIQIYPNSESLCYNEKKNNLLDDKLKLNRHVKEYYRLIHWQRVALYVTDSVYLKPKVYWTRSWQRRHLADTHFLRHIATTLKNTSCEEAVVQGFIQSGWLLTLLRFGTEQQSKHHLSLFTMSTFFHISKKMSTRQHVFICSN